MNFNAPNYKERQKEYFTENLLSKKYLFFMKILLFPIDFYIK